MATEKNGVFRVLRVKKTDSLKTIYAKARKAFTAADLALYANIDVNERGIPGEEVLAQLEAAHKEELEKMRTRKNKKKKRA
jgi:hypothetical protein